MRRLISASLSALFLLLPCAALAQDDQEVAEARKNLMDKDRVVRIRAAQALGRLGAKAAPAAPDLVTAVRGKDVALRVNASQALRAIGADAVPALAEGLKDEDVNVRRILIVLLQTHAEKAGAAAPALVPLIKDMDPFLRRTAINILVRSGDDGVKALLAALKDKEEATRLAALVALGQAKPSPDLLSAVKAACKDPAANVRQQALFLVARQGKDAIPALVSALSDEQPNIRQSAAQMLGNLRQNAKEAVPALEKLLDDKNASVREASIYALMSIGPSAETTARLASLLDELDLNSRNAVVSLLVSGGKEGLPHLEKALKNRDANVRLLIAGSLFRLGAPGVSLLRSALKDQSADVRAAAADGLGQLGQVAKEAAGDLRGTLKDEESGVRFAAAGAMLRVEGKSAPVLNILLEGLDDDDHLARENAARTLGTVAGLVVGDLVKQLGDKEAARRRQAALALTKSSVAAPDLIPALVRALGDENDTVRSLAGTALAKLGNPAIAAATAALESQDDRVRAGAAAVFPQLAGPRPGTPWPVTVSLTLVELLKDKNLQVRIAAATALLQASQAEAALEVLVEAMKDDSAAIRRKAIAGLTQRPYVLYGKPMALAKRQTALEEALKDSDLGVRLHAADGLVPPVSLYGSARSAGSAVPAGSEIAKVLAEGLAKGTTEDRRLAMQVLVRLGADAAPSAEALTAALRDKDSQMRQNAAYVLGRIGPEAKPAVAALTEALKDRVLVVRQLSAQALAAVGPESKEAVPALTKALEDNDFTVRISAVEALGRIGSASKPAVPALRKIMKDLPMSAAPSPIRFPFRPPLVGPMPSQPQSFDSSSAQGVVLQALARIGPAAAEAAPEVAALFKENESQRRAAATALSQFGSDGAQVLLDGLKSKDSAMRALCAEALGGMATPSADVVKALANALDDSDGTVSQQGAFALGQLGESAKAALPQLLTVLKNRKTAPELWSLAAQAVGEMGPSAKEAIPELRDALKNEEPLVRKAAAQALGGIGPQAKDAAAALSDLERDPDIHVRRAATRALARINREP